MPFAPAKAFLTNLDGDVLAEAVLEHDVAVFEILPHHLTQLAAVPPADC